MKYILIVILVAILAGCAGIERKCVEDALSGPLYKISQLEDRMENGEFKCEAIKPGQDSRFSPEDPAAYFRCANKESIDLEEYAYLLHMYALGMASRVKDCLP